MLLGLLFSSPEQTMPGMKYRDRDSKIICLVSSFFIEKVHKNPSKCLKKYFFNFPYKVKIQEKLVRMEKLFNGQ